MNVQKFTTPNGEVMAILPIGDYERLVDAADIASADQVARNIKSGADELIPSEFANRILDGENSIRVWRTFRNITSKELAEKAGISAAYLSEIETGKKEGGIATLKSIASALNVDLDDLV